MTNQFIGGFKMFYTQLIKDPLNILDLTIYFEENCLNHQGKETKSRLKSTSQYQRGLGKKNETLLETSIKRIGRTMKNGFGVLVLKII